ncbi:LppP/LprE family lipoprotein [Nocardia sp. NPDC050712]|uniref:LppP/LprE family lipoprotein n=1 Tax=Nocardia sp. NPDC050712 TaxID=3155518 RepID=UPI0033C1E609
MRNTTTFALAVIVGAVVGSTGFGTATADPGNGHGLCLDVNSELAHNAIASLASAPDGASWNIIGSGTEPISAGCAGVLSYITVEWNGIHPGTHILHFTEARYLGTSSAKPYAYTEVLGRTRDSVSVQYRWANADDPLCCPQGGPTVVTFTLANGQVTANGQFPPTN